MHGNTTNDIFGDANNSVHVLGQRGWELNNLYTFVDEEEFNAKLGPRGKIAFAWLLTNEGYREGSNFEPQ
jgi:hypothetical protein